MARIRPLQGTVTAFDEAVGLGEVIDDAGHLWPFHTTQLADDSRHVEVGTAVRFVAKAGPGGRWEADGIEKQPGGKQPG